MSGAPEDLIGIRLERRGDDQWSGSARRGGRELVHATGSSPGEVLEEVALELDADETERVRAAVAARRVAAEQAADVDAARAEQ